MSSSSPHPRSCPRAMPESRRRPATNAQHGSMGGRQVLQRWRRAMAGSAWQRSLRVAALMSYLLALTTPDGKRLAAADIEGRPLAVAFGFTHCPDVCPTTLMDWSNVLASLGPDGDRLKVLFISVDPERDTPAALKSYMTSFDPRITALTGSAGELAAVAAAFGAHYAKVVGKDGSVSFDHSIKTYILDRKAQLAALSDPQSEENSRAALLRKLTLRQ